MPNKTILIADDDVKLLQALKTRLEATGYEVFVTQDAYQALEHARREEPDLLLLDINMPAGNGFSIQSRLATMDKLAGIPIIFITGEQSAEIDKTAQERGAFAVVHKPFETDQLIETIDAAIGSAMPEGV